MLSKKIWLLVFVAFILNSLNFAYAQSPGNTTPKKIVVLGSSTSYGYLASPIDSSYVDLLRKNLKTYHRGDTIVNLGYPGYTTYEIQATGTVPSPDTGTIAMPDTARNITKALSYNPDLVIINMPTNDIYDNYTDAQSIANYQTVVNMLIAANVQYIITSTQPRDDISQAQRNRLRPFTNLLLSTFPGHVVDYLDLLSNPDYTIKTVLSGGDGIHVNNAGHAIIYNAVVNFPLYKQLVNFTQVITCNTFNPVTYGVADFTPAASSSSALPLTITSSNPSVATIVSGKIHVLTKGTSTITFTQAGNANYAAAAPLVKTLTVNPAPLTIKAANRSRAYGSTNPGFSVTYTGFVNGDDTTKLTTKPQITTTATVSSPVASYPITPSAAVDSNYAFTYTAGSLSVTTVALTIKASNRTKVYGAVNPTLGITYTGFVNGDDSSKLTTRPIAATTATASSPVGSYPITVSGAASTNYTFTYTPGNLSVTAAPLTIKANNLTKVYGSVNPTLAITYTGFVNGDDSTKLATRPTAATTALTSSPVGSYPITVSGAASTNYTFTYTPGNLSVTAAPLTIKANNLTKVYGAANPTLGITYTGFVNSDDSTKLTTRPTAATTAVTSSPVGSYPITVSGAASTNYTFTYTPGNLSVTAAPLTIKANNLTKVYGAANPALTITYTGFVNGDDTTKLTTRAVASTTAITSSPVGSYPITVSGASSLNYTFTYTPGSLSVTAAALSIKANNATKIYGSVNPILGITYTGFVNGDDTTKLTTRAMASTSATTSSPVGSYTISASGASSPNYTFNYIAGSLSITAAALTVKAANETKTYGAANPVLSLSYSGFVNGDDSTRLTTRAIASTIANTSSPVGSYPITVSGASSPNYTFSYTPGSLSISAASLAVKANNTSKVYGSSNPGLSLTYTGFINGDDSTKLTTRAVATTTANASSPVGSYPITVSGASSPNYTFSYTSGNLNITPAAVSVTANNETKIYGSNDPALGINYTGFVNGDDSTHLASRAVASTTATSSSSVGTYPITVSGASSPNYTFSYNSGSLSISRAALTIKADNVARAVNTLNPVFDFTYTGFVNGDDYTKLTGLPIATTTATTSSPAGTYPISVSGASSPNYTISYTPGTLIVSSAPPPVVSSISPADAKAGTTVTIVGSNFDNTTSVSFGGVPASSFTVVSSTEITAVVAEGSASGNIAVTTPTGTIQLGGFTYVYDLPASNFQVAITSVTCKGSADGSVSVTASQSLNYTATITGNGLNTPYPFTSTANITNLAAGTYSVCITVAGQSNFSQCYNVVVTEPKDLSVYSVVDDKTNTLNLNFSGGNQYNIQLNGATYTTTNNSISLPLQIGNNELAVTTDKFCQGAFTKVINSSGKITPYPVPFQNTLNINLGNNNIGNVIVEVHSIGDGKLVYSKKYANQSGVLQFDLSNLDNGVYAFHLVMDSAEKIFKVIKQ